MNFGRETFRERSNATIVSPNEYWMHLGRSDATIVSPNALLMHPGCSNATIVSPNEY